MYSMKPKAYSLLLLTFQIILLNKLFSNSVQGIRYRKMPTRNRPALPSGYTAFPQFDVAYKIILIKVKWDRARRFCSLKNASLAMPDSEEKVTAILGINPRYRYFHVGIHRSNISNEWVTTGSPEVLIFLQWSPGYPRGTGNCAGITGGTIEHPLRDRRLINYGCDTVRKHFVCEIPYTQ